MSKEQLRVLIVEDEFITIEAISSILEEMNCIISGDAMSAEEAIEVLEKGETDLAILDINIKGDKDGIWIGNKIKHNYKIPFIFLTAFGDDKTIMRAVETGPYGYLVKPFSKADVYSAIEIAMNTHTKLNKEDETKETRRSENEAIFIRDDYNFVKIQVKDILFVKSDKNYLEVHLPNKTHLVRGKLSDFIENLPTADFMKVHRSYAINISKIDVLGGGFIKLGEQEIPLGGDYKTELLKRIKTF
jgi:DNA-binding LytR/AlgR family response regulator